jgi:hypothetical protein
MRAKRKQEDFVRAIETMKSHWYTVILESEKRLLEKRANKLRKTVIILSTLVIILSILILID